MIRTVVSHLLLMLPLTALTLTLPPAVQADIAVIVHPQNKLTALTRQELKKIFLGRMPLFPDSNREIHAIDLQDEDPVFSEFYHQVIELDGAELKRYRAYYLFSGRGRLPVVAESSQDVIEKVAADVDAIGYVDSNATAGRGVRVLMLLPGDTTP